MGRTHWGLLLVVVGLAWAGTYTFYSRTGPDGKRVDLIGLSFPKDVFSYEARRSSLHPRWGERFQYPHFYIYWVGFLVPVVFGIKLIRDGIRQRTYYPKDYGKYGR